MAVTSMMIFLSSSPCCQQRAIRQLSDPSHLISHEELQVAKPSPRPRRAVIELKVPPKPSALTSRGKRTSPGLGTALPESCNPGASVCRAWTEGEGSSASVFWFANQGVICVQSLFSQRAHRLRRGGRKGDSAMLSRPHSNLAAGEKSFECSVNLGGIWILPFSHREIYSAHFLYSSSLYPTFMRTDASSKLKEGA